MEIGTGVRIVNSDIGDSVDVGHNAVLHGVAIMDGAMIGPYARLTDTYVGTMTELASTAGLRPSPTATQPSATVCTSGVEPGSTART
ncbi:hypothetical protein GCM10029964_038750 [Kibdelosporangium lantanae]